MSWNLIAAVEQADHDNVVRPMRLLRASRGITHSASIAKGDLVSFSGIDGEVTQVWHKHQPDTSDVAPVSEGMVTFRLLYDDEIAVLERHGWKDIS